MSSRDARETRLPVPTELHLLPQHRDLVRKSAITDEVARARGYRSVCVKAELERLGFGRSQRRTPALLIPIRSVHGEIVTYQLRPDKPRIKIGKAIKYETPRGSRIVLDVPLAAKASLGDPSRPLFVTEGARKADAGVSAGLCTVSVLGVWNWRGSNELGGKLALPDWESIALNDRPVYLVFDSDVMTKAPVHLALGRLKELLKSRGANVRLVYLPSGDGGSKVGLDDFLARGKSVGELLALASDELRAPEGGWKPPGLYKEEDGCTVMFKPSRDGDVVEVRLCNFTAHIIRDVVEDDGAEESRTYTIKARIAGRELFFDVSAARFGALNWIEEQLGAAAIVCPVQGMRAHVPVAFKTLSEEVEERRTFTHTGWRHIDGEEVFLHAGGAIGAAGTVESVEVRLPPALRRFELPAPPTGLERAFAVRESLALLTDHLARDRVMFPLTAATYLAALGSATVGVQVVGTTGARKTELAALQQRHFGAEMDAQHLAANWSCTANALGELLFLAKDTLVVIDDFCPRGRRGDVAAYHAKADAVFRGVGNRAGRGRMRPDGTLRSERPARAVAVSTGEDVMDGHSLRARTIILEVRKGEVNLEVLTQRQAAAEQYSAAMAAFVQWIAGRRDEVDERRRLEAAEERDRLLGQLGHGRTATIGGQLLFGLRLLLEFARDVGAIELDEHDALLARGRSAILEALGAQQAHHEDADPAELFVELLAGALQSGRGHLADIKGGEVPLVGSEVDEDTARLVGWRKCLDEYKDERGRTRTRTEWRPGGDLVGFVDVPGDSIYLLPGPAHQLVSRLSEAGGERIVLGRKMLSRALDEAGMLVSTDGDQRTTKKKTCAGVPRNAHHMRLDALVAGGPGRTGRSGGSTSQRADEARGFPERPPERSDRSEETGSEKGKQGTAEGARGRVLPELPDLPVTSGTGSEPVAEGGEEAQGASATRSSATPARDDDEGLEDRDRTFGWVD